LVAEAECVDESREFQKGPLLSAQCGDKNEPSTSTKNVVTFEHRPSVSVATEQHYKASTSMSFKVSGDLTLELVFDIGGQTVSLEVTESGLSIEMESGMKFTVPMKQKSELKKAV
jgi:hypothetical protein